MKISWAGVTSKKQHNGGSYRPHFFQMVPLKRHLALFKERSVTICANGYLKLMLFLVALYAPGWSWGLPSEFDSATDSPVPLSPLAFVADYFNPHIAEKYPATHQVLLLPFYGMLLLFWKLKGDIQSISLVWPYGFRDPSQVFSSLIIVSRVISSFMAAATILSLTKLHFKEFDKASQYFAMILVAGSGVFTYYARVGTVDVPYLFWWAISLVYLSFYIFDYTATIKAIVMSAIFSALSIGTKDQAAGLVLGSGLIILLIQPESGTTPLTRFRHALLFALVTLVAYTIVAVLPQPMRWMNHLRHWTLSSAAITDYIQFDNSFQGHINLLRATVYRLAHVISPVGIAFAVIGLLILIGSHSYRLIAFLLIPIISYYALIIFNIRFVYERFLLPVAFLLVILAGIGVISMLHSLRSKNRILYCSARFAVILALVYHFISGYLPVTYVQIFDLKRHLTTAIASYVPKGSTIVWKGKEVNLPNSAVYQNYKLILPEGKGPWAKSVVHVFGPYDADFAYILSDNQQLVDQKDAELLHVWRYPDWINRSIPFNLIERQYYLYKRAARLTPN